MVRGPGIGRGPGMMGEGDGVAKGEGGIKVKKTRGQLGCVRGDGRLGMG